MMVPTHSSYAPIHHYLHLPDVRIHYSVAGQGRPLVLLHGMGSSGRDWLPVAPELARHYHLILIDLRGHGQSSLSRHHDYSVRSMAADVWQVVDDLGLNAVSMLGLSLGGCVTLQSAILHPARLEKIVLVNTFAKMRSKGVWDWWAKMKRLVIAVQGMDKLAWYVASGLFQDEDLRQIAYEELRHNDLGVILRTMAGLSRMNLLKELPHISAPTLVLIGDRDKTVPPRCADDLLAGIPQARLEVISDAGHALPYDQPEKFLQAVLNFMQET